MTAFAIRQPLEALAMILRKALIVGAVLVSACREPVTDTIVTHQGAADLPPISKQFTCLPQDAAFVAAHRGTSREAGLPENSALGIEVLISKGYLFAEIDVASIKDGTHILFHDGKWDDKSAGTGIVAATPRSLFETITLRDTEGVITKEKPPKLINYLKLSKNNMYLEIDFKSSADYETVIKAIRDYDMADQVILIAYTAEQAKRLASLAPEMMISASAKTDEEITDLEAGGVSLEKIAIWRGKSAVNSRLLKSLRQQGIPILRLAPKKSPESTAKVASLIVTDYAFNFEPIIGLNKQSTEEYKSCLTN